MNQIRNSLRPYRVWMLWGVALLLPLGCASKPPMLAKPVVNTWTIAAPLETVWKSSISALVEKGTQIDIINQEAGLIVAKEYFDRGSVSHYTADPASYFGGEAKINLLFTKVDEKRTRLTVKPTILAIGRSPLPIKATSNGKLERDYHLLICGSLPMEKSYKWLEDVEPTTEEK